MSRRPPNRRDTHRFGERQPGTPEEGVLFCMARCPRCGRNHDRLELEPRFGSPDAYSALTPTERATRARIGDDWCRIGVAPGCQSSRYFLRGVAPFSVDSGRRTVCWGLWVEATASVYQRVVELWDDPCQSAEPPLPVHLANALPGYPPAHDIRADLRLRGLGMAPEIWFAPDEPHPFAEEQRTGVTTERVGEWIGLFCGREDE